MADRVVFAIPGDLSTETGGYIYDRRVMAEFPRLGIAVEHLRLPDGFPEPDEADLAETAALFRAVPADAALLVDGLAYGAIPPRHLDGIAAPVIALIHHPLGLETGLAADRSAALIASETAALRLAHTVIAVSPATARTLHADFAVPAGKIAIAGPGTDPASRATGGGDPPSLLAVGAVSERKAYGDLVAALAPLADFPWRLTIVGSVSRAPETARTLRGQIAAAGLSERIALTGEIDAATLAAAWRGADLFVMPSRYEGFGMVLAEAVAHGLPVVTTSGGALAETFIAGTGLQVRPADPAALSAAIARMLREPALRAAAADASWRAATTLRRWPDTAADIAAVIRKVHA